MLLFCFSNFLQLWQKCGREAWQRVYFINMRHLLRLSTVHIALAHEPSPIPLLLSLARAFANHTHFANPTHFAPSPIPRTSRLRQHTTMAPTASRTCCSRTNKPLNGFQLEVWPWTCSIRKFALCSLRTGTRGKCSSCSWRARGRERASLCRRTRACCRV